MESFSETVKVDSATPGDGILVIIMGDMVDLHTDCHSQVNSTFASYS